jgi:2-phosphoglycerate kinase
MEAFIYSITGIAIAGLSWVAYADPETFRAIGNRVVLVLLAGVTGYLSYDAAVFRIAQAVEDTNSIDAANKYLVHIVISECFPPNIILLLLVTGTGAMVIATFVAKERAKRNRNHKDEPNDA